MSDVEDFVKRYQQRMVDMYAGKSLSELKDLLQAAHDRAHAAIAGKRDGLQQTNVLIEDASVHIENLKYVISIREESKS
jgi:hypothetical protein